MPYNSGLLSRALRPSGGLLQPVMWDRVRREQGLLGTEGGGRGMEGGGGRGYTPPRGWTSEPGELPRRPTGGEKLDWKWNDSYREYTTVLPKTGMKVTAIPTSNYNRPPGPDSNIRQNMSVQFSWRDWAHYEQAGGQAGSRGARGSMKRATENFSEVFKSVMDLKRQFNPSRISFSAASPKHMKVYDRLAPKIADALGGRLSRPGSSSYVIDLP